MKKFLPIRLQSNQVGIYDDLLHCSIRIEDVRYY
jgi:hypothetical protein